MNNYEDQYYIVEERYDEDTLYLSALQRTENRDYDFEEMRAGGDPLYFENAYKTKDIAVGKIRPIMPAHMNMSYLIVNSKIRSHIDDSSIYHGKLYPSVIIDDAGQYHDDFWFFNIYGELNILDCENSEIRDYDPDDRRHDIVKYKLKNDVLDNIPEDQRLVFMMPNTETKITFVHQKIVDIFEELGVDNIRFHKMSEWYPGKQFRS